MEFFFSGVSSHRELGFLQAAEVKNILLNPYDFRTLEHSLSDKKLILDSLAYKFFKQGRRADYDSWRSQIDAVDTTKFFYIVAPDVIGDPEATLVNWRRAKQDYPDLPLLPVFQWSAPESALDEYLESSPVVGIGGLIPLMRAEDTTMLAELTDLCEKHPGRFHIFGLRWLKAFNAIKSLAYAADSSVWLAGVRYGQLIFTHTRSGQLLRTKADRILKGSFTPESLCIESARNIQTHLQQLPMTTTAAEAIEPVLPYFTLDIQASDRLRKTPITVDDIANILSLLGHPQESINAATIKVSASRATVRWTADQPDIHPTN